MIRFPRLLLLAAVTAATSVGCGETGAGPADYDATVDRFVGRIVSDGKPVEFGPDDKTTLQLIYRLTGESFGIPIKPDGTFTIGWMPVGAYTARLDRQPLPKPGKRGGQPTRYTVPEGLKIEQGKTEYTVELGKGWKS
jgi:hypothetical protein